MNIAFAQKRSLLIKIGISLALLLLFAFKVDFTQVTSYLTGVHNSVWLSAIACMLSQIIFLSYRWHLIINAREKRTDILNASQVTVASTLANYLFITSLGGLVVRVALSVQSGFSVIRSIAGTAIDRIMTLLALLLLLVVFLPISLSSNTEKVVYDSLMLIALLSLTGLSFFGLGLLFFRRKIIFSHRKIATCCKYLRVIFTDRLLITKIITCSVLAQLSYFVAIYVVTTSYGLDFSPLNFLAILPLVTIAASLPIGYGGWGIREGAFVYGLGIIHIPVDIAFSISIQIGLVSIMSAVLAAFLTLGIPKSFGKGIFE